MRIATLSVALATLVACIPDLGDQGVAVTGVDVAPTEDTAVEDGPSDYGPSNSWWHASQDDVPSDLAGTGFRKGDIAGNFTAVDQHGDTVELYQFFGQVIVIDVFTEWCGPCQDMAPEGEEVWQQYGDQGFVYLAAMQENKDGKRPDSDDAARWASSFGLSHPVLADADQFNDDYAVSGYPTVVVIDREMTIVEEDLWPFDPSAIEDYL